MGQMAMLVVGNVTDEGAGWPRLGTSHRQIDRVESKIRRRLCQSVVKAGGVADF